MNCIYIIRNTINDKVYIGQTTQNIRDRWLKHKSDSKHNNTKFYHAINKYGIENFYCEILEDNVAREDLDDRERFWITYYDSYNFGYNSTLGGQDHPTDFDPALILEKWNEGYSETEISKILNLSLDRVSRSLIHQLDITPEEINERKKKYMQKYSDDQLLEYWQQGFGIYQIYVQYGGGKELIKKRLINLGVSIEEIENRTKKNQQITMQNNRLKFDTPIFQFDLSGNLINVFSSIKEASIATQTDRSSISHCALGDCPTAHGYVWLYKNDPEKAKQQASRIKSNKKIVNQYDIKTHAFISSFESISAASRAVKAKSSSTISAACNKGGGNAYGFYWSFEK